MDNKDKWMKCAMNLLKYVAENPDQATKLANSNQIKILKESLSVINLIEDAIPDEMPNRHITDHMRFVYNDPNSSPEIKQKFKAALEKFSLPLTKPTDPEYSSTGNSSRYIGLKARRHARYKRLAKHHPEIATGYAIDNRIRP